MTDERQPPIPVRLGAQWVALTAARLKLRTLLDQQQVADDAIAHMEATRTAISETYTALGELLATLQTLDGNLASSIAARRSIGTEAAPL